MTHECGFRDDLPAEVEMRFAHLPGCSTSECLAACRQATVVVGLPDGTELAVEFEPRRAVEAFERLTGVRLVDYGGEG